MKKLLVSSALLILASAQPLTAQPSTESTLLGMKTVTLNGTCKQLLTPEGDKTDLCDKQLINLAFPSGNSSFMVGVRDEGGISFRGRDSAAKGDVATLMVNTIILTGRDLSEGFRDIKAKGQCTYTNPEKGPVRVECSAKTAKGTYKLSYISDGVWPPK